MCCQVNEISQAAAPQAQTFDGLEWIHPLLSCNLIIPTGLLPLPDFGAIGGLSSQQENREGARYRFVLHMRPLCASVHHVQERCKYCKGQSHYMQMSVICQVSPVGTSRVLNPDTNYVLKAASGQKIAQLAWMSFANMP